jgi:hypothetical protein
VPASRLRRAAALVAVGALVGLASGCAPTEGPDRTQTVADACASLADAVDDAMTRFAETDATDLAAAAEATADVRAQLDAAAATVDNPRVDAVVAELGAGFAALADAAQAAAAGDVGTSAGLAEATDRIRAGVAHYHDLCARS